MRLFEAIKETKTNGKTTQNKAIKETITVGQAADYYGMKIGRNNMICCPFHNDHHPSMKLNPTYYYCFGCGATGDVIQAEEQKAA